MQDPWGSPWATDHDDEGQPGLQIGRDGRADGVAGAAGTEATIPGPAVAATETTITEPTMSEPTTTSVPILKIDDDANQTLASAGARQDTQDLPDATLAPTPVRHAHHVADAAALAQLFPDVDSLPATPASDATISSHDALDFDLPPSAAATWQRISRRGPMRKHNLSQDDDAFIRTDWPRSTVRTATLAIVRRWMEQDSMAGRTVLGGGGSLGASRSTGSLADPGASTPGVRTASAAMFNWDSAAPHVEIGKLLRDKRNKLRSVSEARLRTDESVAAVAAAEVRPRSTTGWLEPPPPPVWGRDDEWGDMVSSPAGEVADPMGAASSPAIHIAAPRDRSPSIKMEFAPPSPSPSKASRKASRASSPAKLEFAPSPRRRSASRTEEVQVQDASPVRMHFSAPSARQDNAGTSWDASSPVTTNFGGNIADASSPLVERETSEMLPPAMPIPAITMPQRAALAGNGNGNGNGRISRSGSSSSVASFINNLPDQAYMLR